MNNLDFCTILERNPIIFLLEVEKAIQKGYVPYLTHQYGSFSSYNGLYEINLFRVELPFEQTSNSVYEISTYSAEEYLTNLSAAVRSGFKLIESSIEWNDLSRKRCTLVNMNDSINTVTSKEQLEDLSWEDLKVFGDSLGVERNRLRSVYTNGIIKALNKRRELLGLEVFVE